MEAEQTMTRILKTLNGPVHRENSGRLNLKGNLECLGCGHGLFTPTYGNDDEPIEIEEEYVR